MKKLIRLSSSSEAEMAKQALQARGVETEIRGAKEYAAFFLGMDIGRFDLLVEDKDFLKATDLLQQWNSQSESPTPHSDLSYFKQAVIFSLLATLILPIVFNLVGLYNLGQYVKSNATRSAKLSATCIVLLLQIPTLFVLKWMLKSYV